LNTYGLLKFEAGWKKKLGMKHSGDFLEDSKTIQACGIKNKDNLLFKTRERVRSVSRAEGIQKTQTFGVDPSTLDIVMDSGFKVPKVLVLLRNSLVRQKAFQMEGIFRLSGSESKCKDIKWELNTNTYVDGPDKDPHCCASLIKRWFGELPKRIFTTLTSDQIESVMNDVDESMKLMMSLPEPEKSLFMWLVDLLYQVTQYQDVNKMSPANLAICVAPQMMEIVIDNPMDALMMNQKICAVVKNAVTWKLKEATLSKMATYASLTEASPEIHYEDS